MSFKIPLCLNTVIFLVIFDTPNKSFRNFKIHNYKINESCKQ